MDRQPRLVGTVTARTMIEAQEAAIRAAQEFYGEDASVVVHITRAEATFMSSYTENLYTSSEVDFEARLIRKDG